MAPQNIRVLDELRLFVVVDNETDWLSSIDEGVPQSPEALNLARIEPVVRDFEGRPCRVLWDRTCCACHGYSVLVTGISGTEEHTMLFDVGPYADVWLGNAAKHRIDLAKIEAVFLSHWHFDHSGGFPKVIETIMEARKAKGLMQPLPVSLHPDRPDQRGFLQPTGAISLMPEEPTFEAIAAAGGAVEKHGEPHPLCGGFFYGSGRIDRATSYETGLAGHYAFRGGQGRLDEGIFDERYLAAEVQGRGVTVLSACSHAGVVNACLSAQKAFAPAPVDVVLGGYHLSGKVMEQRIGATVRDLQERIRPRIVAPGHCTGWRAKMALAAAFAPGHYGPSVVGSLYTLRGA